MNENHDILIADIGNTRTKFSYLDNFYSYNNNYLEFDDMHEFIYKLRDKLKHFIYASVNTKAEEVLLDILKENDVNHIKIDEFLEKYNKIDFSDTSGLGTDRKLGMIGANSMLKPPFITIDCGTAVTINIVNENNKCLGGAIFPDVELQLKVLNQLTDALPKVSIDEYVPKVGSDTNNAIRFGVLSSVTGGIIYAVDTIIKDVFNGKEPEMILTGGLSHKILPLLQSDFSNIKIDEHLVLKGIMSIAGNHISP